MKTDELCDLADNVKTRNDFIKFLGKLYNNLREYPDDWDNKNLSDYIDGFHGFAKDIDGYYKNWGEDVDIEKITWNMLADMLIAARVYE